MRCTILFLSSFVICRFGTPERFARSIETEDENAYSSDEGRLISALLSRFRPYKKLARPVRNASQTVDVHFGLDLKQILDLDEKDQVLETRIWKEYVSIINST